MSTVAFKPEFTGVFNPLQERLIDRCIRKNMPVVEIVETVKLQRDVAKRLLDYPEFFKRKIFKKTVMVVTNYAGSAKTSRKDIIEQLYELDSKVLKDFTQQEVVMITNFVYDTLPRAIRSPFAYNEYCMELFTFVATHKDGLFFVNPISGMPVYTREEGIKKEMVAFKVRGKTKSAVLLTKTGKINSSSTASTGIPNCIHSLDSGIMVKIKEKLGDMGLAYIHDSVGAHPNDMGLVRKAIKEVLVEFLKSDALQKIADQLLEGIDPELIPEHLKTVPYVGTWDVDDAIEDIMNNIYAFS